MEDTIAIRQSRDGHLETPAESRNIFYDILEFQFRTSISIFVDIKIFKKISSMVKMLLTATK